MAPNLFDRVEHLELGCAVEAVARLNLDMGGASGAHLAQAGADPLDQLVVAGFAHGANGGHDAAACGKNVEIRRSRQTHGRLGEAFARVAGVGVTIGERGHDHPPLDIDLVAVEGRRITRANHFDAPFVHDHIAALDHAEIAHRTASARAGQLRSKCEDSRVDEDQS